MPNSWVLQQYIATRHVAKDTKLFLSEKNVKIINFQSFSQDINPIENL